MQSNAALEYDYSVAKLFTYTTILFGFLGMLIGTLIAAQLAFPELNYMLGEYGTFSRLRPMHTNIVVFGFTLSGIWATFYYVGQRVLKVSMAESKFLMFMGKFHFWLYFVGALIAVVTLLMGYSQSKEYAQFEWPIDIVIVLISIYVVNLIFTLVWAWYKELCNTPMYTHCFVPILFKFRVTIILVLTNIEL